MRYLLDTHAILWYVDAAQELPYTTTFAVRLDFDGCISNLRILSA